MTSSILQTTDLRKSFGGIAATAGVSMSVAPGERRLVIGPNGAGKTTLFNLITGDLKPSAGRIALNGMDITTIAKRKRAHMGLARTYQILHVFPSETIIDHVVLALLGLLPLRWNPFADLRKASAVREEAMEVVRSVGLENVASRRASETSYGERRRLELAMALAQRPRLLLLDEPLAGLSIEERQVVVGVLNAIPREVTIVMIEHDMDVALDFADSITVLNFGEVVVEGTRSEVVSHPRTKEIYFVD
ncbi:MAG: ABC transporter ATP-binding protein [Rhizobiaceae bacterium]|nr:ABC transporter ATP-binding protein [Rhizobiaceae bacterium]